MIRWSWETVELEKFPGHTQEALRRLRAGTFTVITLAFGTQVFVKRLSQSSYQLGLGQTSSNRLAAVAEMP
jgi:hypothetical protein